jgi:hypothetical protein
LLIVVALLLFVVPVSARDDCAEQWSIAGTGGAKNWLRVSGYQIGMTKSQALQIRRVGLRTNVAQDEWQFILTAARVVLIFEKNKIVAGTLILESADYQEAYVDLVEQLGLPDDMGRNMVLWRNEACDTVKFLVDDGDNVALVIQSLAYYERIRGGP